LLAHCARALRAGNPRAPAACCGDADTPGCFICTLHLYGGADTPGRVQMKQTTHIMNEKRIMLEMDHPFIIQLMATGSDKARLFMVTELVQGGELFSVLTRVEVLDEAQIAGGHYVIKCQCLSKRARKQL
jgi:serine/threonine protein kinase